LAMLAVTVGMPIDKEEMVLGKVGIH
jgi:hypothetical protein